MIEAEIGERNITVVWDNRADKTLGVPNKLEQIVYNLLKNALEVLPDDGTIVFNMYQNQGYVIIEVCDTGPGIPASIRSQLFDPFFTTKPNGTGLGLWVVYRLVQSMQGVIEIESEEGQGSMFQVAIPIVNQKAA